MLAFLKDLTWTAIVGLAIILGFCIVLAVFWSKREWNSRKIRVGLFLEREYREDVVEPGPPPAPPSSPPADETTAEWPQRKE